METTKDRVTPGYANSRLEKNIQHGKRERDWKGTRERVVKVYICKISEKNSDRKRRCK